MNIFIGLTDYNWYNTLRSKSIDEVNFWRPGSTAFHALMSNDLFLFKLKKPYHAIVGGGFFVSYSSVPIDLAWKAFGEKNGTKDYQEFRNRIAAYREKNRIDVTLPHIGCIILTQPFFFDETQWITQPNDWPTSTVVGKRYDTAYGEGERIYQQVMDKLNHQHPMSAANPIKYTEGISKHRLGQGAFRILVTDAYHRRCAVSGEKTLPVLQAAHIKPYAMDGTNDVTNGILLRSDLHTLFDDGYLTITKDLIMEVSHRLREDYGNGKDYYKYNGAKLLITPDNKLLAPSSDLLAWHNEQIYLG